MKSISFIALFLFFHMLLYGQLEFPRKNSVFMEIAGSGGLGSLNYERAFLRKSHSEFTFRAGLSFAPIDKNNGTTLIFPIMVNSLIGKSSHKFELGLGQGISITTKGKLFALSTLALGYRYQSINSKWFYRLTYTPLISYIVDFQIQHWGGLSIGYSF